MANTLSLRFIYNLLGFVEVKGFPRTDGIIQRQPEIYISTKYVFANFFVFL
jgi:hypothetical protein